MAKWLSQNFSIFIQTKCVSKNKVKFTVFIEHQDIVSIKHLAVKVLQVTVDIITWFYLTNVYFCVFRTLTNLKILL